MKQSIRPAVLYAAIEEHGYGAFAQLMQRYAEEAVMRAFLQAERRGDIQRDDKLSHARLVGVERCTLAYTNGEPFQSWMHLPRRAEQLT